MRNEDVINIGLVYDDISFVHLVGELWQMGGLTHCHLSNTTGWLITHIHPHYSIVFDVIGWRVPPQEPVEMDLLVLQPHSKPNAFLVLHLRMKPDILLGLRSSPSYGVLLLLQPHSEPDVFLVVQLPL